jgi:hypothetical protein
LCVVHVANVSQIRSPAVFLLVIAGNSKYFVVSSNAKILIQLNSSYPNAGYPDRLGPSGKLVESSTNLTCLETTCNLIEYSTVLWLLELQISRGRKVVNIDSLYLVQPNYKLPM